MIRECKYHVDLEYRNVGQGLFYTGVFRDLDRESVFSMVYDCGTLSNGNYICSAIEDFIGDLDGHGINLLIISHFDADHINYIDKLIAEVGAPNRVILPYLTPSEVLIAYSIAETADASDSVLSLIIDPTAFFLEKGTTEVIFLHPNGEDSEEGIESQGFDFYNGLRPYEKNIKKNGVEHFYDSGFISIGIIWKLKFFQKSVKSERLSAFKALLHKKFKLSEGEKIEPKELIKKKGSLNALRGLYKEAFGKQGMNNTSVVVHHFKICNNSSLSVIKSKYSYPLLNRQVHSETNNLLTGDLKIGPLCYKKITNKWRGIENTKFLSIQIPHHGANNFMCKEAFSGFQNVKYWVINFGLGNRDRHPASETLKLFEDNKKSGKLALNHQYANFSTRIYIYD